MNYIKYKIRKRKLYYSEKQKRKDGYLYTMKMISLSQPVACLEG
jgi:hypothetical protein